MAEVTKPIALDESFNTTESTSRNLADVLAEGLDNIAESVVPRAANEIPITSGSATNTKDYIDTALSGKQNKTWSYVGGLYPNGPALDVSNYNELSVIIETGLSGGTLIHNFVGLMFKPMFDLYPTIRVAYYGSASYNVSGDLTYNNGNLTYAQFTLTGWDTNLIRVFGR